MRLITFFLVVFVLSGCRKTKLEGDYAILQGKWQWVGATEYRTLLSNGNTATFIRDASEFPDAYYVEFERKGKVHFLKNQEEVENLRLNITGSSTNCNALTNGCTRISLNLNSKEDKSMSIFVNNDSLKMGAEYIDLPLKKRIEGPYEYSYTYYFVSVN